MQVTGEALVKRSDDNEATLRKRLASFHKSTAPLVDFYQKRGIHSAINADRSMDSVFATISAIFDDARAKRK